MVRVNLLVLLFWFFFYSEMLQPTFVVGLSQIGKLLGMWVVSVRVNLLFVVVAKYFIEYRKIDS